MGNAADIVEQSKQYKDDVLGILKIKIAEANLTRAPFYFDQMDPQSMFAISGAAIFNLMDEPFLEFSIGDELLKQTEVK